MKTTIIAVLIVFLSGCASPQLTGTFWSDLALQDIKDGRKARSLIQLRQVSNSYINDNHRDIYLDYYSLHLKQFCSPKQAFLLGVEGKPENLVCTYDTHYGWVYRHNWNEGKKWQSALKAFVEPN